MSEVPFTLPPLYLNSLLVTVTKDLEEEAAEAFSLRETPTAKLASMHTPLNIIGLEGWVRRYKSESNPHIFWPSLLSVLPEGVETDDPRVVALLQKYNVPLDSKPEGLKRQKAEPVARHRLNPPEPPPDYMTARLKPQELEMLLAAEARTLKRSGWSISIDGGKASIVTLKHLQDRQLIRHVGLTEEGWEVLTYWRSQRQQAGGRRGKVMATPFNLT